MGWLADFVTNPLGTVGDTVTNFVQNPAKSLGDAWNTGGRTAAELAALYYGGSYLMGAGGAGTGAGVVDAAGMSADQYAAMAAGGSGAGGAAASSWIPGVPNSMALMGGANLAGGLISAAGQRQAASTQADAANAATGLQRDIYNQQTALNQPFAQAGLTAQNKMLDLLGLSKNTGAAGYGKYAQDFGMNDFVTDPGYAFRLSEGQKALDRSAAARSGLISGGALKAATRYGQDMGSQEYQNAYNRYQTNRTNQLQPLGNLQAVGVNATNQQAVQAGQYGTNAGNLITGAGNAIAAGQLGSASTLGNALASSASAYQKQDNFNRWLQQQQPIASSGTYYANGWGPEG